MKAFVEVTDTFGGEANYSWVRRYEMDAPDTNLKTVRRALKLSGYTGCRTKKQDYGDTIRLDFVGMCRVMFITFGESHA
jgi:hypothetical protein